MKKLFLCSSLLMAILTGAKAQEGFSFGAGVNAGIPVGNAGDISSFTVGGEVQGEYKFGESASVLFTTGYTHFIGKDLGLGIKLNYGAVPLIAGARYYPAAKFFIGGQAGYSFFTGDANSGGFTYKPQAGYDGGTVQVAASYNAITKNGSTIGWIALSGIFKFGGNNAKK